MKLNLFFERFLSPARDGPPDIDVDIESGRREEVIQYVYERYDRRHAAQVANGHHVPSALGAARRGARLRLSTKSRPDALRDSVDRHTMTAGERRARARHDHGDPDAQSSPPPRHPLGRHGAVRSAGDRGLPRRVGSHARAHGPAVGQGRLRRDRPREVRPAGLGMLDALHRCVRQVEPSTTHDRPRGVPQEDAVYDLLCEADTVGVFQVESRAQMATLPRVRPRSFYDMVIEVAIIRPGPDPGQRRQPLHPTSPRRRAGHYLHPRLEPILRRTLGVPLFQEQLMEMAVAVAGFSPAEADELRQAMAAKRSESA